MTVIRSPTHYITHVEIYLRDISDEERLKLYRRALYDANDYFSGDDLRYVQGELCDKIIALEEKIEHPEEDKKSFKNHPFID